MGNSQDLHKVKEYEKKVQNLSAEMKEEKTFQMTDNSVGLTFTKMFPLWICTRSRDMKLSFFETISQYESMRINEAEILLFVEIE